MYVVYLYLTSSAISRYENRTQSGNDHKAPLSQPCPQRNNTASVSNTTFTRAPVCSLLFWWASKQIVGAITTFNNIRSAGTSHHFTCTSKKIHDHICDITRNLGPLGPRQSIQVGSTPMSSIPSYTWRYSVFCQLLLLRII